jgi:hypothetical protein
VGGGSGALEIGVGLLEISVGCVSALGENGGGVGAREEEASDVKSLFEGPNKCDFLTFVAGELSE